MGIIDRIKNSEIVKSIWREGFPDSDKNKMNAVMESFVLHIHPAKLREKALKFSSTFCLGGLSFFTFIILTVTGVILMFYYRPTVDHAYHDMKDLEFAVTYGLFLRNLHRWSAHAMVFLVMAHMARVFFSGAYNPPKQFNWVVGVVLLILTLLLSYTGYLLPWDLLAYWAITVGTNMASAAPFLGADGPFHELLHINKYNDMRFLLLGGSVVGQNALLRFYVLHCVFLPLIAGGLMLYHFWKVRKDGGVKGPL